MMPLAYVCLLASEVLAVGLLIVKPLSVIPPAQISLYALAPLGLGAGSISPKTRRILTRAVTSPEAIGGTRTEC